MTKRSIFILMLFISFMSMASPTRARASESFADVPETHWARAAIERLASRGVIDRGASFGGASLATRWEIASAVARAMSSFDRRRATREDAETLRRLADEFSLEIAAIGARRDAVDVRTSELEGGLGGWSISGQLRLDARHTDGDLARGDDSHGLSIAGPNDFDLSRYRLYLRRRIDDTTSFTARIGRGERYGDGRAGAEFDRYFVTTSFFSVASISAGVMELDWERDLGLRMGDGSYFGGGAYAHFLAKADLGFFGAQLAFGRLNDTTGVRVPETTSPEEMETYAASGMITAHFGEKVRVGVMAHALFSDEEERTYGSTGREVDRDLTTVGAFAAYRPVPSVELKAIAYHQRLSSYQSERARGDADAFFWRAAIDASREALGFTSLWLEYGEIDDSFTRMPGPSPYGGWGADIFSAIRFDEHRSRFWAARAEQTWGGRVRTYERFVGLDLGTPGAGSASQITLGAAYRLNAATELELAFDRVEVGDLRDDAIVLRTSVAF